MNETENDKEFVVTVLAARTAERARRARGLLTGAPRVTNAERELWQAARDAALAEIAARPPLAPNAPRRGARSERNIPAGQGG